jgi:TolB-like protein/DNA-binding winged helix-turn-helix (wHTH) protein/Tfp pilus assembly protein PilF
MNSDVSRIRHMAMPAAREKLQIGDWLVDPAIDTISRGTENFKLEPRTMRLLLCLAEQPGAVVSQERLLNEVWTGVVVGPASVYQSVSQLRKLLGDVGAEPTYIATVARKGYRLVARVSGALLPRETVLVSAPAEDPATLPPARRQTLVAAVLSRRKSTVAIAVLLLLAIAAVWSPISALLTSPSSLPSIVVLPFVDSTASKEDQPFCDGLTEELSNLLAQLPTIKVVGSTSAFAYRDKPSDLKEIGLKLGVSHVLEGSMRRSGSKMRVLVTLIDTRDGYQLWSASFDRLIDDVVSVQQEIARAMAAMLEIRLTQVTTERFAARASANAQAYRLFLLGRYYHRLLTREANEHAIELFRQAIATDPAFALAYVGLASELLNQNYFSRRGIKAISEEATPLLEKALALQPQLSDAYAVRGVLAARTADLSRALPDLKHATELNPNSRDAYAELGYYYLIYGQPREALTNYSHAAALDPLSSNLHAQRCLALQDLARYAEASAACEQARAIAPKAPWPLTVSSMLAESQGKLVEAVKWMDEVLTVSPDVSEHYARRASYLMKLGSVDMARQTYEQARSVAEKDASANSMLTELRFQTAFAVGGEKTLREDMATIEVGPTTEVRTLLDLAYANLLVGDGVAARQLTEQGFASPQFKMETLNPAWEARTGFSTQLLAAAAEQAAGQNAQAAARLEKVAATVNQLIGAGVIRHDVYALQARLMAMRGDPEGAMRALTRAVELGWRAEWQATREPYLRSLWSRNDFKALMGRVKVANQKVTAQIALHQTLKTGG